MCLSKVYRGKELAKQRRKLPERGYYWKVAQKCTKNRYWPPCFVWKHGGRYKAGENVFKVNIIVGGTEPYSGGTHVFRHKVDADRWWPTSTISVRSVRVIINKKDITSIGNNDGLCIVARRATFPQYIGA